MSDETTAAQAPEEASVVVEEQQAPEPQTDEASDAPDLSALYDKIAGDEGVEEDGDDESAEPDEAPAPVVEAPKDIPQGVAAHWAAMPEAARQAVAQAHRDLHARLSEQGRQYAGVKPIRDELVEIAKEFPSMKDMKPADLIREMRGLARVSQAFNDNPVQAMLGIIKQHNLQQAMAAHFAGQPQAAEFIARTQTEMTQLKRQLADAASPEKQRQAWESWNQEVQNTTLVNEFARTAEHYGAVEGHLPQFIAVARSKLGVNAPARAVLESAYEMAVTALLPDKASPRPAPGAAQKANPEKVAAAKKAASVNVSGRSTGSPAQLSGRQLLAAAYDKARRA